MLKIKKGLTLKRWKGMALGTSKGFTLIELLIVIAIIGTLATVVTSSFSSVRARSRGNVAKSDINAMMTDYEAYKAAHLSLDGIKMPSGQLTAAGYFEVKSTATFWNTFWTNNPGFAKNPSSNPYTPPGSGVTYTLRQKGVSGVNDPKNYVICAEGTDMTGVLQAGKTAWVAKNSETFENVGCPTP